MAKDHKYFKTKVLTLGQQAARMAVLHPQLQPVWGASTITWTGPLQPSKLSEEYTVRIAHKLTSKPEVRVLKPQLQDRSDGARVPHVYPGRYLCLYYPGLGEWGPDKLIADTIVPWTALWLYHYEVWHATGKDWLGGGIHLDSKKDDE